MVTNNSSNEPTSASGTVLQGQGVGTASAFSTATYPATTTVNQILYSSATNTVGGITTANSGVLATSSSGVPSIDTTNFAVLSTGLQIKGNNTNTAPPAGFIGQSISSTATAVATTSGSATTIASVALTAGIWDISAIAGATATGGTAIMTAQQINISTSNNAITGTLGIELFQTGTLNVSSNVLSGCVPQYRVVLSGNTTYYLVVANFYTSTTCPTNGRISATRVG